MQQQPPDALAVPLPRRALQRASARVMRRGGERVPAHGLSQGLRGIGLCGVDIIPRSCIVHRAWPIVCAASPNPTLARFCSARPSLQPGASAPASRPLAARFGGGSSSPCRPSGAAAAAAAPKAPPLAAPTAGAAAVAGAGASPAASAPSGSASRMPWSASFLAGAAAPHAPSSRGVGSKEGRVVCGLLVAVR